MAYFEGSQAEGLRREVVQLKRDDAVLRTRLSNSDRQLQQTLTAFNKGLEQVHTDLVNERTERDERLTIAQAAAVQHADALVGKLEKKRRQQEAQELQLSAELSDVKQSTNETSARLNGISNEVGTVQREVESVNTAARQARGDMGLLKGAIATNSDEIRMLRDLGDKHVYEFTLAKSSGLQRVGDIQVMLDKTDAKRNRFTVEIVADDQRVEKRDKNINEPVQFYVPGRGAQPYELVVNEVGKDTVKGYLATPIVTLARTD
jgi:chromosome segregation ATPase